MDIKSHWNPDADFSACPFFIRRMDTVGFIQASEVPAAQLPLFGFIYVASGEVLVDVSHPATSAVAGILWKRHRS